MSKSGSEAIQVAEASIVPTAKLTKSFIDGVSAPAKDTVYWDDTLKGFGLKVTPKGRKVFIALYRTTGARLRKYTIGPYGQITPAQARSTAQKVFAAKLDGRDPAGEKKVARRRETIDRLDAIVDRFLTEHAAKLRSGRSLANRLRREVLPVWGARSIHDIKRRDVMELVSAASAAGAIYRGINLHKALKRLFNWCVGQAILESSPASGVPRPGKVTSRDRVLTDEELAAVITAARQMRGPFGAIVEMLALTGQRRTEVSELTWDELDLPNHTWTIPAARAKNGKTHIVHLSTPVIELLMRIPRLGRFVFTNTGARAFNDFSDAKRELDKLCGVTGWRLHDLRRTCVSGMARLGIAPHVADKILNHQTGTISGVAAVYQRHDFILERRDAMERWGTHIQAVVLHTKAA